MAQPLPKPSNSSSALKFSALSFESVPLTYLGEFRVTDTWRAHYLGEEADIHRELQASGVEHIPLIVCGRDFADDIFKSDIYVPDDSAPVAEQRKSVAPLAGRNGSWRCGHSWMRITQRFHYRFIVDFIGKPLEEVKNSKQMMQVVFDAFTAHRQTFELCGIIHRDISSRNILINDNGHGILNDWDFARQVSELERRRYHERMGTRQFMSCLLLMDHHSERTIQDNMESFVYIILWHGLRYFSHNKPSQTLRLMKKVFDYERDSNGRTRLGGESKEAMLITGARLGENFRFTSPPLNRWMKAAFLAAKQWIEAEDSEEDFLTAILGSAAHSHSMPTAATAADPAVHLYLQDHTDMARFFSHCLSLDWPLDDIPSDVLPGQIKAIRYFQRGLGGGGWDEGSSWGSKKKNEASHSRAGSSD